MSMTRPRRFRDMSLTEDEASRRAYGYIFDNYQAVPPYRASRYLDICTRARRLLPLWRAEAIRRNRLWFALIGLGLDIEGDSLSDMTSREMLERIDRSGFRIIDGLVSRGVIEMALSLEEIDR